MHYTSPLTTRSRVLNKPVVTQPANKFRAFYRIRTYSTIFKRTWAT